MGIGLCISFTKYDFKTLRFGGTCVVILSFIVSFETELAIFSNLPDRNKLLLLV